MAQSRPHPNLLAGPYVDRATHWRKDPARLAAALADPQTRFVPVWRTRNLVAVHDAHLSVVLFTSSDVASGPALDELIFLGEFDGVATFALEITAEEPSLPSGVQVQDLRAIAGDLAPAEAGLLAYARAMIYWRDRHRYCGRCGSPTQSSEGGHVRLCSNGQCGVQFFPRIDPAVIVLVCDGERALLGRQAAWAAGRYSTIAGFVEPGESLEDAVIREVAEETGVVVNEVDYHSSQPWPFPSSLMLGFIAYASADRVERRDDELEDVRWVTRAQIAAGEVALPTTHSISFRLIEEWYDAGADRPLREEPNARLWTSPFRSK